MNGHKVEMHAEARIDFYSHVQYLASQGNSIENLLAFILEMETGKNAIARNPLTWRLARHSRLVRKFGPTKRFRFLIFYIIPATGVPRIIEFSSPGRQPRWAGRL
jgi:hypothetical protein